MIEGLIFLGWIGKDGKKKRSKPHSEYGDKGRKMLVVELRREQARGGPRQEGDKGGKVKKAKVGGGKKGKKDSLKDRKKGGGFINVKEEKKKKKIRERGKAFSKGGPKVVGGRKADSPTVSPKIEKNSYDELVAQGGGPSKVGWGKGERGGGKSRKTLRGMEGENSRYQRTGPGGKEEREEGGVAKQTIRMGGC